MAHAKTVRVEALKPSRVQACDLTLHASQGAGTHEYAFAQELLPQVFSVNILAMIIGYFILILLTLFL